MADSKREKARKKAAGAMKRVRDRRRRVRNRLESMFGRKKFVSFAVLGAAGKTIETVLVPFLDPGASVNWTRGLTWVVVLALFVCVALYWERLAKAAESAGDAVEDAVDPDS